MKKRKPRQLVELTRARMLRYLREPEAIFWIFVFPLVLTVVLGIAFRSRGVATSRVGVLRGPGAQALVEALRRGELIEVLLFDDEATADRKLRSGAVAALVHPGKPVRCRFDPSRFESASARLRLENAIQRAAGRTNPVRIVEERVEEIGSRYIDFLLPGVLGMNLMATGLWALGYALVTDRERRLLRRLIVTPMRRSAFLASFMLARIVFMVAEVAIILLFATLFLEVPIHGSIASLACIATLGTMTFASIGMLLAARVRTIGAIAGLANVTMMPQWLLSGTFFSWERFPEVFHPFIRALPLTPLTDALRATMLEGATLASRLPDLAILAAWCLAAFTLALALFRWD